MTYYNEMKNYFTKSFSTSERTVASMFNKVESLINEQYIEAYYFKNLFLEDNPLVLFLFCKNNHIIYIEMENNIYMNIKYFNGNSIDSVTMKENIRIKYEKELNISPKKW